MKKKLVSLLSLILAVVMVFPVGVFATEGEGSESTEGGTATVAPLDPDFVIACDKDAIYDSGNKSTAKLSVPKAGDVTPTKVTWAVDDENILTVDDKGNLTAKKAGTTTVVAIVSFKDGDATRTKTIDTSVTIIKNDIIKIDYDPAKTTTDYAVKQKVSKSDLHIIATYADGSTAVIDNYTYTPTAALKETDDKITVKLNGVDDLIIPITVAKIDVKDLIEKIEITAPADNKEFEVGTKIYKDDITIKLTYAGGTTSNITASASGVTVSGEGLDFSKGYHTFSNDDAEAETRTIKVTYAGLEDTVAIKVKKAQSSTGSGSGSGSTPTPDSSKVTVVMKSYPTKRNYKVGDTFDAAGMGLQVVWNTVDITNKSTLKVSYVPYTFVEADKNKTEIELDLIVTYNGESEAAKLKVTGLTIGAAAAEKDDTKIKEVTSVVLKEDAYPEGYEFTLADVDYIKVKFLRDSSSTTIENDEFESYSFTSGLALEVFTSAGERKTSSTYRDTIRSEDIYTDDDDKLVNMALSYKYYTSSTGSVKTGYKEFTIELSEADIAYYYKTKYITEYDDLEDALKYCNEQDDAVEEDFDFSDVDDDEYLMLKLGKDFSLSSSYEFTPENNIVIDLNGNDLSLYTDTFDFDDDEDYKITVKNTSEKEAKLTYRDKDIEIILQKGDSVAFEEGKDVPGIYTVTVTYDSDTGTVTADPKLTSGKVQVGKGSKIKFTITPKKGYEVNTVKVNSKSVLTDKDHYSVDKDGVAEYTLENVTKDTTLEVTFKAQKKEWNNPFSDVKSTAAYYSAVEFVYENELFKGTTTTTFSPNSTMTRAMFVTVLGRLSGMDDNEAVRKYGYDSDFTDVSSQNGRIKYAVPYIKWAVDNGIVEGYGDGTFGPENEITHQQMYVMMYRYARFVENKTGSIGNVSLSMSDRSSVAEWAADAVKYAQYNNYLVYTNTTKTRIDPTGDATRSELAMLLESFCQTVMGWAAE